MDPFLKADSAFAIGINGASFESRGSRYYIGCKTLRSERLFYARTDTDLFSSIESHRRSVMSFLLPSDFSFLRPAAIPIANDDSLLNERARVIALLPLI